MSTSPFPNNLTSKILHPKDRIQHHFQVMAGGRVAVQVQAAGRFQHPVQFHQARGHHHQVSHHLVLADESVHRVQHGGHLHRRGLHHLPEEALIPVPGIVKRVDLRFALHAALVLEQHRIRPVAVERRVQVDQVHALVRNILLQNFQVIAIEQGVFRDRFHGLIIEEK